MSVASSSRTPSSGADPDTVAMLAAVKTRLTVLVVLTVFVLFAQGWQTVVGMTTHRQMWEYAIEAPTDDALSARLAILGTTGWEIVSARRATSQVAGETKGIYEMILRRPLSQ